MPFMAFSQVDTSKKVVDSLSIAPPVEKSSLENKIDYYASDSIKFNVKNQIIEMFGNAELFYEDIEFRAEYVKIDLAKRLVLAHGILDSNNVVKGKPKFKDGEQEFESDTILYCYETEKGIIRHIFTEQGGGYLHGEKVKKYPDNSFLVSRGAFTTCDLKEHTHFQIRFNKAKVIPNDKIVTGPVWLEVEGITTPLALPFGFFPNKKGRASGILIPSYGESANRGFFLENGGYYFGINDYIDLALRGDIYSRGSWGLKVQSNYRKRYKYNGGFNISFARNIFGERDTPDFQRMSDFFIKWTHNQDPKARPKSRFSANVQAGTSNYNKYNPSTSADYLSSTYSSSISYSTQLGQSFNFTANINHNQNRQTHVFNVTLPELALSSVKFYPLRRTGKPRYKFKILDNINISYNMNARNTLQTIDTMLFNDFSLNNFNAGIRHSIPVSMPMKLFKVVTMNNSFTFNERWYFNTIEKHWDNTVNKVVTDTVRGFKAAHDFAFSSTFSTKLYTFLTFKKGFFNAFRHVLTPSVGFSYRPDFAENKWGYYKYYLSQGQAEPTRYSIFEQSIFGGPGAGKQSLFSFAFSNNLEMKIRSKKDTISGLKKIALIDNFTVSANYNAAADSLKWSTLALNGRTRITRGLDLSYSAAFSPYVTDTTGRVINKFEWEENKRLFRKENNIWRTSLNYNLDNKTFRKKGYVSDTLSSKHFTVDWSLNFSYTLQYSKYFSPKTNLLSNTKNIIQTLSFGGDIEFTPNWRVGFATNYDFETRDFGYTTVNIHRDLHCWEIIFNWIPAGPRKSYNMTIRVKSAILQDLKLEKKTDWRDLY